MADGSTRLTLGVAYARLTTGYNGTSRISTEERIEGVATNLGLAHFLGDGWSLEADLPVLMIEHFVPETETDSGIIVEEATERVIGPGDLGLAVRYELGRLWDAKGYLPSLSWKLGFGMPTGVSGTTAQTVAPTQFPMGGTFTLRSRLLLTQFVHPQVSFNLSGSVEQPLHPNAGGVTRGTAVTYGLGVLGMPGGGVILGATARGTWLGRNQEEEKGEVVQSGGHYLAVEADVGVAVADGVFLAVRGRVPVFADVNGIQISETFMASLLLAWSFGGDDQDHDHDHSGRVGDVEHAARRGKSFDLETIAVPGKVTIIDFWADWCEPCKGITARLEELAEEHPGELAIRKVEVPGPDSPVAREHTGGRVHLPLIWFLDRSGKKVAEIHGNHPDEIIETVRDLLD